MNGMIDEIEDVKLLRERGIICNHLQSDGDVASLWNSLGKCGRLTNVGYLDKTIEDLNRYHSRKWKVCRGEVCESLYIPLVEIPHSDSCSDNFDRRML